MAQEQVSVKVELDEDQLRRAVAEAYPDLKAGLCARIEELERMVRCVQLYGVGYTVSFGNGDVALKPDAVTVHFPAGLPETDLEMRSRLSVLELQRDQVLAYVAKLECSNCDHVHEEGWCDFAWEGGGICRCGWGPPQVTKDIRDLLKEA